jgi:hypothetical protein
VGIGSGGGNVIGVGAVVLVVLVLVLVLVGADVVLVLAFVRAMLDDVVGARVSVGVVSPATCSAAPGSTVVDILPNGGITTPGAPLPGLAWVGVPQAASTVNVMADSRRRIGSSVADASRLVWPTEPGRALTSPYVAHR